MRSLGQANSIFRISLFDRLQETFEIGRAGVANLIDIDCRRSRDVLVKQCALVVGFDLVDTYPFLADVALFSLDYPHSLCLWPNSADHIARLTKDMDPVSKEKILVGNARKLYKLPEGY